MSYFDDDPYADMEAVETLRRDADLEMAEMAAVGNAIWAGRKAGRCMHQSAVGYNRGVFHRPEQEGLKKQGQLACTDHTGGCNAVWESDEDWYAAMDDAIQGA